MWYYRPISASLCIMETPWTDQINIMYLFTIIITSQNLLLSTRPERSNSKSRVGQVLLHSQMIHKRFRKSVRLNHLIEPTRVNDSMIEQTSLRFKLKAQTRASCFWSLFLSRLKRWMSLCDVEETPRQLLHEVCPVWSIWSMNGSALYSATTGSIH